MNIFLIGTMGAGKTSVGKKLSNLLHLEFIDSDVVLAQRHNRSITDLFMQEGEDKFRYHEEAIVAELTSKSNIVLATGGGVILSAVNRDYLHARGIVCYLQVSVAQQMLRLAADNTRPLLCGVTDLENFFANLQMQRNNLYASIADITINTDRLCINQTATMLQTLIENEIYA